MGVKNEKLVTTLEKNTCRKKEDKFSWNRQGIILQSRGMGEFLEQFLDDKGAFYNGSESDDGDNNDENYTENMEAVVHRCFSK